MQLLLVSAPPLLLFCGASVPSDEGSRGGGSAGLKWEEFKAAADKDLKGVPLLKAEDLDAVFPSWEEDFLMKTLCGEAKSCRRNKQEETAHSWEKTQAAEQTKYQQITSKRAVFVVGLPRLVG